MIRATTLTGTRDEIIEAINNMKRAGIKQVAIQPTNDPRGTIESFSREIMRKMKEDQVLTFSLLLPNERRSGENEVYRIATALT